ncbi:helix-turn-helix transcriptional regulator [Streptomyces flaveolus]|uniref:helix-turn-helix transcriptional regulator n=1 Tax=Streptomyces flaveolus TaxID=67297 RepID=UPI003700F54A
MTPMAPNPTRPSHSQPEPERTQFRDLIRRRRAELNESYDTFAAKAVDPVSGSRVTRGWIIRLEKGETITPPQVEELRALAAACELPVEALQDAAGSQFHGVDPLVSGSSEAKAYVRKLDQLPADQRDQLLRLIDTLTPPPSQD